MARPKNGRSWLYAALFLAGAANAPLFYRLVTPAEVLPVEERQAAEEDGLTLESRSAPQVALRGVQLGLNEQPMSLMASSAPSEEASPGMSAPAGVLPSTVGLTGGGGSSGGGYGGSGGGGSGMPGGGSPGFAGGGGFGSPAIGRPGPQSSLAAPTSGTPTGPSNTVSKPQPRLFVAYDPNSPSANPQLTGPGANAAPAAPGGSSPSQAAPASSPPRADVRPRDTPLESFVPKRPSDQQLPNVSQTGPSALKPLEEGTGQSNDGAGPGQSADILDVIDSNIESGLILTAGVQQHEAPVPGPALAELEQRDADHADQPGIIRTTLQPPSSGQTGGQQSSSPPIHLETLSSPIGPSQVPEPFTLALTALGLGLIGISRQRWRGPGLRGPGKAT